MLLSGLVALRLREADAGGLDQTDGVVSEAGGQAGHAGRCQGVVGSWRLSSRLRGGGAGLVAVLGQQVGGRGAVLGGVVPLAGVVAGVLRLLAGQGEALRGPGVDQVMLVVADHHLLQAGAVHLSVLEAWPSLDVSCQAVVVMRLLVSCTTCGPHQLVSSRQLYRLVAGPGLVVVVTDLVQPVRVGRGGGGRGRHWTSVHHTRQHTCNTTHGN